MDTMKPPPLDQKLRAMQADADNEDSDDAVLEEWKEATRAVQAKAPKEASDPLRATGEPLADTSNAYRVENVRKGRDVEMFGVPVEGKEGLHWLETPFSALDRDLERLDKNSPEYKRVQALYGPARIAHHRKNNLDINTGKPRKDN